MTVVNLNKFRKAKAKSDKKSSASINRIKFGRSKAAKVLENEAEKKRNELLDRLKRED
jgi:peroxiredoxin family protein